MRILTKKLAYIFLLFPIILLGQINESDSLNIKASLSITGFYQGGNVETLIFRTKTNLSFKPWKNWIFKNQSSYVYQAFGKEKADEDILSLNFLYLNPERKVYPFVLGFVSTNFRREINLRSLVGAGATVQIVNKNKNWLKLSLSSEYEQTDFAQANFNYVEYNDDESINTLRGTIWVNGKYHLFKEKMIFTHELYYQPSLELGNNYRWQGDVSVDFPIWKYVNFKINYRQTFESVVIAGQKQEDRFLTFGFTLKSY
jgi:hypothetical protein